MKYHCLTYCIMGLALYVTAAAAAVDPMLKPISIPQATGVRLFLTRSQLPAHLKDVLENNLLRGQFYQAPIDFQFNGSDQPADWHLDPKSRKALAHVNLSTGVFTLYPGFFALRTEAQIHLLIHLGLHTLKGLGLSRISEPTVKQLTEMMVRDYRTRRPRARRDLRAQFRRFIDQKWAVGAAGTAFLTPGMRDQVLPPWPFENRRREVRRGR